MANRSQYAIITASTADYTDLLEGWIGSLQKNKIKLSLVTILNCGLKQKSIGSLKKLGINIIAPEWDISVPKHTPQFFKAMIARPNLPKYVPNTEYIIWMDADSWIQDKTVIKQMIKATEYKDISCCIEADRNYCSFYRRDLSREPKYKSSVIYMSVKESLERAYGQHFPPEVASYLSCYPMINSGIFCARSNSKFWSEWNKVLTKCIQNRGRNFLHGTTHDFRYDFLVEQTSLNYILRCSAYDVCYLPPAFNWTCHLSLPTYNKNRAVFCESEWPFSKIKIVHMIADTKRRLFKIKQIGNGQNTYRETSLASPYKIQI